MGIVKDQQEDFGIFKISRKKKELSKKSKVKRVFLRISLEKQVFMGIHSFVRDCSMKNIIKKSKEIWY